MANTKYNTTQDLTNKLQEIKGATKLKFYENISHYYDEMNYRRQSGYFQFEEDMFSKGALGIAKIRHEVILMKFLQTKRPV